MYEQFSATHNATFDKKFTEHGVRHDSTFKTTPHRDLLIKFRVKCSSKQSNTQPIHNLYMTQRIHESTARYGISVSCSNHLIKMAHSQKPYGALKKKHILNLKKYNVKNIMSVVLQFRKFCTEIHTFKRYMCDSENTELNFLTRIVASSDTDA